MWRTRVLGFRLSTAIFFDQIKNCQILAFLTTTRIHFDSNIAIFNMTKTGHSSVKYSDKFSNINGGNYNQENTEFVAKYLKTSAS